MGADGAPSGAVVVADYQAAQGGGQGARWTSVADGAR